MIIGKCPRQAQVQLVEEEVLPLPENQSETLAYREEIGGQSETGVWIEEENHLPRGWTEDLILDGVLRGEEDQRGV